MCLVFTFFTNASAINNAILRLYRSTGPLLIRRSLQVFSFLRNEAFKNAVLNFSPISMGDYKTVFKVNLLLFAKLATRIFKEGRLRGWLRSHVLLHLEMWRTTSQACLQYVCLGFLCSDSVCSQNAFRHNLQGCPGHACCRIREMHKAKMHGKVHIW